MRQLLAVNAAFIWRDDLRQPEVQHLHHAVRTNLDVGGLEVAVNDAVLVRGLERLGDLPSDPSASAIGIPDRFLSRSSSVSPSTTSRTRAHAAVDTLQAVNRRDVGMIERGQHARLAFEPREPLRVCRERGRQNLDGNLAASVVSRARYTSPMPPAPSRETMV